MGMGTLNKLYQCTISPIKRKGWGFSTSGKYIESLFIKTYRPFVYCMCPFTPVFYTFFPVLELCKIVLSSFKSESCCVEIYSALFVCYRPAAVVHMK